jgi:hypothetical protein
MKKVLLVVALLLLATPVFAATTVSLVQEGTPVRQPADGNYVQTIRVDYTGDVNIAAFALDINMNGNTAFWNIRGYKTGESNAASPGYGIFPSRFRAFITPLNGKDVTSTGGYGWADTNYSPLTAWNEPGAVNTGIGFRTMVVELGTLYAGDANRPLRSGTLFRFDVNNQNSDANTITVAVAADALRGGVVNQDATGATALTFTGTTFAFPAIGGGVSVPNLSNMTRTAAITALTTAGLVKGIEANVPPANGSQLVRTVIAQKPAAGTIVAPGSAVDFNAVSYPVKDAALNSLYANWVTNGRPQCWAFPRQCRGDADGKKSGQNWVASSDLAILKGAFTKNPLPLGGTCADLDHKKTGQNWVASSDLTTIKIYFTKAESLVPICGNIPLTGSADSNYWYWCMPSGTCPTGQLCAPVAVCPNTP